MQGCTWVQCMKARLQTARSPAGWHAIAACPVTGARQPSAPRCKARRDHSLAATFAHAYTRTGAKLGFARVRDRDPLRAAPRTNSIATTSSRRQARGSRLTPPWPAPAASSFCSRPARASRSARPTWSRRTTRRSGSTTSSACASQRMPRCAASPRRRAASSAPPASCSWSSSSSPRPWPRPGARAGRLRQRPQVDGQGHGGRRRWPGGRARDRRGAGGRRGLRQGPRHG
jgi:hypothetical protein